MLLDKFYNTEIFDIPVTKRASDGFFNAKEVLEYFNKKNGTIKRLPDFWLNEGNNQIYLSLCAQFNVSKLHTTTRGNGGGTWMHESLFNTLYNWMNKLPNQTITRDELIFCDYIIESFKGFLTFEKQEPFFGYSVDLYCNELKLCIEFDEKHHSKASNILNDIQRQKNIEKQFGVSFLRHKKGDNFSITINKIMQLWKKQ